MDERVNRGLNDIIFKIFGVLGYLLAVSLAGKHLNQKEDLVILILFYEMLPNISSYR